MTNEQHHAAQSMAAELRQDAIKRASQRIAELEQDIAILTSIRDAMQKALEHHEACNE